MDLYNILEIKPNATDSEIKKAYHKLAKIYHPDKNKDKNAIEKFQKIQSAYEILINDKTRLEYQNMDDKDKSSFVEVLEKVLKKNLNVNELKKYGINLDKTDFDYIQQNIINFFSVLNVNELLGLYKKGTVPRKDFNNVINCSDSDVDKYDENMAEYFYNLPFCFYNNNSNDIKIDLSIKVLDITNNNKRKIKIKRKINNKEITSTFIFNLSKPYIIFVGGGDVNNGDYGNLFIKLNLLNNLYWDNSNILLEQNMSLYSMIYGLDIKLDLGFDNIYNKKWIPINEGYIIPINDINIKNYGLTIKLVLNYESSSEKEQLLKQYFN